MNTAAAKVPCRRCRKPVYESCGGMCARCFAATRENGQQWRPDRSDDPPHVDRPDGELTSKLHSLYRFYDADGDLLYVGISATPQQRLVAHMFSRAWWPDIASITIEHYPSRSRLEYAEAMVINDEDPVYNVIRGDMAIRMWKRRNPALDTV